MRQKIHENKEFITATTLSIITATALALIAQAPSASRMMNHRQAMNTLLQTKVFFSTLNIGLLTALTLNYFNIYRNLSSKFAQSLLLTSGALLIYAVTSSPLLHVYLGFRGGGLGPFTFIPDIFVSAASMLLLYRSYQ